MATLSVPTSAVPALIGSKGNRIKDINASSGARVRFDTNRTKDTTTAYIRGSTQQIQTAISLLKLAVLHARAAHSKPPTAKYEVSNLCQAHYDFRMFAQ